MKKFFLYIMTLAAVAFAALSCVQEEIHEPGEKDLEGCYGVYFPAQETELVLDPAEPTEYMIKVARTNSEGDIEVPFEFTSSTDVFEVGKISFADGQAETELSVKFTNSEVGVKYSCSFKVEDPQYASQYSTNPVALDMSVVREKWNELGQVSFTEAFMWGISVDESEEEYAALIYQNDADKNIFRLENPFAKRFTNFTDGDEWLTFRILQKGDVLYEGKEAIETKIDREDLIFYDDFNTGYTNSDYNDKVWLVHPSAFNGYLKDPDTWGSTNKVLKYQENGLPVAVQLGCFYYLMNAGGGWDGVTSPMTIVFPGQVLTDYSIKMTADVTVAGKVPVTFKPGTDVSTIKYKAYEGTLNTAQKNKYIETIGSGEEEGVQELTITPPSSEEETPEYKAELSFEKTGVYTLVAVTFNDKGEAQEGDAVELTYLADADAEDHAVVVTAGLELTSRFGGEGYTKLNSMQYYIYGKDLTEVYYYLFLTAEIEKYGIDAAVEFLRSEGEPVAAEELALINAEGSSDLFTDLSPLTSYTLVVYASNGYAAKVVTADLSTEGLPLELVGNGVYTFSTIYQNPIPAELSVYFDPNVAGGQTYKIPGWGGGVTLTYTMDETNKLTIPAQPFGVAYENEPIFIGEAKKIISPDDPDFGEVYDQFIDSYYDKEKNTIYFCLAYFLEVENEQVPMGVGVETFVFDTEEAGQVVSTSSSIIKLSGTQKLGAMKQYSDHGKAGFKLSHEPEAAHMTVNSVSKVVSQTADKTFVKINSLR